MYTYVQYYQNIFFTLEEEVLLGKTSKPASKSQLTLKEKFSKHSFTGLSLLFVAFTISGLIWLVVACYSQGSWMPPTLFLIGVLGIIATICVDEKIH